MDLVIRGLFICEFACSHLKNLPKMPNFRSKCVLLSANSVFAVQNIGTYLLRITRPNCNDLSIWVKNADISKYKEQTFTDLNVLRWVMNPASLSSIVISMDPDSTR